MLCVIVWVILVKYVDSVVCESVLFLIKFMIWVLVLIVAWAVLVSMGVFVLGIDRMWLRNMLSFFVIMLLW